MIGKNIFVVDGNNFSSLEEFYEEIGRILIPGASWGKNLDAFDDILRGGFGTLESGFVIRWIDSDRSRERLGYRETVRQLEKRLEQCHPSNRRSIRRQLEAARAGTGPTVFDWLVEIIRSHGPGGPEDEDGVRLVLE